MDCQFEPNQCLSYTNCTGSDFVQNWTEHCCQPQSIRKARHVILPVIGCIEVIGIVCNIIAILTFIYLYCFPKRIKRKFNQEFPALTEDPVFFLILHLSFCDLLYCIIGLSSYFIVFYYGYFPFSAWLCTHTAFLRYTIGMALDLIPFILQRLLTSIHWS